MNTESATQFEYPESRAVSARLTKVKKSLVRRFADEFSGRLPLALIRRAVEEADALARATGYPHLVLPVLAEETVRRVSDGTYAEEPAVHSRLAFAW